MMAEGKRKFIEDAAQVIDGRVAALEEEYKRVSPQQSALSNAADRAAIDEAKHCARLIRALAIRPYRGDPYKVAYECWNRGETS
jgi:hypothetical protein